MDEIKKQEVAPKSVETKNAENKKVEPIIGRVVGCKNLNIRHTPSLDAKVVQIVECGSEVMIDMEKSTGNFYEVCTASGAEGYCMKKFIETE